MQLVGSIPPRDLDLNTLQQQGVRLAGHLVGVARSARRVRRRPARLGVERVGAASSTRVLERVDPIGRRDARAGGSRARRRARPRDARGRSTCAPSTSRASCGRPATGVRTRGCTLPCSTRAATSASARASPRFPGSTRSACGSSAARKSHFIDGVADDALLLARYIATRHRVPRRRERKRLMANARLQHRFRSRTTTRSSSAPVPRAPRPRCCSAAPASACCSSTGRSTAPTRCRRTRCMRGGVMQLQRWGLLDEIRAAGTPAIRRTHFHYGDDVVQIAIGEQHGVDALLRTAPDGARPDARRRRVGRGRRGCRTACASPDCGERRDGCVSGITADVGGSRVGCRRADRHRRRRYGLDDRQAGRRDELVQRTDAGAYIYGYFPGLDAGSLRLVLPGPAAMAGVIPTNDGVADGVRGHASRNGS